VKDPVASSVAEADRTAGALAVARPVPLVRQQRGAMMWGAWDEAHPDDGLALDAPVQVSARSHVDKWAGWNWEHQTGLPVVAGADHSAILAVPEEATPAGGRKQRLRMLHQRARWEIGRRQTRFSMAAEYPEQVPAKSEPVFDAQGRAMVREFDFAPGRKARQEDG
jgi:hypothetical protein